MKKTTSKISLEQWKMVCSWWWVSRLLFERGSSAFEALQNCVGNVNKNCQGKLGTRCLSGKHLLPLKLQTI